MNKTQAGFTLVELAIVLVVIGLILGMAFKGKDLIDSAKVKNQAAQVNKIIAAVNIFYEKYGFYPGDGCTSTTATLKPSDCKGTRDGLIRGLNHEVEPASFWILLQNTGILTANDRRSVFGQNFEIYGHANQVWLDFGGHSNAEARFACALDKMMDDGHDETGMIINGDYNPSGVPTQATGGRWKPDTDCWELKGQANVSIRILP